MEWLTVIQELISKLGFPICCVGALFWQMIKERELHKQESDKWAEAINRNTTVIQELIDYIRQPGKYEK